MALEAADGHHGRSSPRGDGSDNLIPGAGVRRLTPIECERLQAFPDNWTHGSDGKRYAAMGDAVTVNVIQWLGERMMAVDKAMRGANMTNSGGDSG
jgi:DNA (cytosine-5)-methyltransferase 1